MLLLKLRHSIHRSAQHLEHVFKKLYKRDLKKSGSGIGLAVCDEIIRLHSENIKIESRVHEGTKELHIANYIRKKYQ